MSESKDALKTGTTTMGIVCSDGIVIAADKRATIGSFIYGKEEEKVVPIVDDICVTTAGSVSEIQRFVRLAKAELKLVEVRANRKVTVKEAANILVSMIYANIRQTMGMFGGAHFLVAGKDTKGFSLYESGWDGVIDKKNTYFATGSGMLFALPILENKYKAGLTVQEGIKLAAEAINAAQLRDVNSGGGFDVYTITKDGLKKAFTKDLTVKAEL